MGKNWKTTLFGLIASLAVPIAASAGDPILKGIASGIGAICGSLAFYFAKDKNVTGGTLPQ